MLLHLNHHSTSSSLPKFIKIHGTYMTRVQFIPIKMAAIATHACNYVIKRPHPQLHIRSIHNYIYIKHSCILPLPLELEHTTITLYGVIQNLSNSRFTHPPLTNFVNETLYILYSKMMHYNVHYELNSKSHFVAAVLNKTVIISPIYSCMDQ